MKTLLLAALLLPLSALAAEPAFTGTVKCEGVNPHVARMSLTLTIDNKGAAKASTVYQVITDDGENHAPLADDLNPRDIMEATLGYQRVNFVFAHHNTVIKLMADGDIFGGASENDNEKDPYQGVLFYESGNGNASISRFQVTCRLIK